MLEGFDGRWRPYRSWVAGDAERGEWELHDCPYGNHQATSISNLSDEGRRRFSARIDHIKSEQAALPHLSPEQISQLLQDLDQLEESRWAVENDHSREEELDDLDTMADLSEPEQTTGESKEQEYVQSRQRRFARIESENKQLRAENLALHSKIVELNKSLGRNRPIRTTWYEQLMTRARQIVRLLSRS